jgi:hypothetical protein
VHHHIVSDMPCQGTPLSDHALSCTTGKGHVSVKKQLACSI